MNPPKPVVPVRADDAAHKERWQAAAKKEGVSLNEFIRRAADDRAGGIPAATAAKSGRGKKETVAAVPHGKRTDVCVHRRRPDEYCPRCDG